jgi:HlyD family secretion protein
MTANVTVILTRKNDVLVAPHSALKIRRRELRKVYPEIEQSRWRRKRRLSPQEKAERARRRFLEGKGSVWVYRDGKPERERVRFGATDARNMEILKGLEEGDKLIIGIRADAVKSQVSSARSGRASWIRRRILGGF